MAGKKIGWGVATLGLLGAAASILVDFLPGANTGIQSAQILGIEISLVILLIGAWILLGRDNEQPGETWQVRDMWVQVINLPVIAWVLIGFFAVYVLFFVSPMFLNSTLRMEYFYRYLPEKYPIGNDLLVVIELMKAWFTEGQSPYLVQFYPPFTYVFFAPLLLIDNYPLVFRFFTLFSLVFYCFLTLLLPLQITRKQNVTLIVLLFVSGLISYGFQFELERGQYNVFTFLLCLLAIYIFHNHPKYRLIAYILFSISIQLKIYPAIFIVLFVDDWKNWKAILRRFAGIGLFNILLLFIMGPQIFLDFLGSVSVQLATPGWTWNGNHSMNAFVFNLAKDGFRVLSSDTLEAVRQNTGLIENLLFLIFILCFAGSIVINILRKKTGIDPYLLVVCMIGALTIPVSNDYTLSILTAPLAILLSSIPAMKTAVQRVISILMVFGISFAYASVLIPFKYKPYYLNNAFPPLFVILVFVMVLNWIHYKNATEHV
jgi:Glycosyltransferase family 87